MLIKKLTHTFILSVDSIDLEFDKFGPYKGLLGVST